MPLNSAVRCPRDSPTMLLARFCVPPLPTRLDTCQMYCASMRSYVVAGLRGSLHNFSRCNLCALRDRVTPSAPLRSQQHGHVCTSLTQDASALVLPTLGCSRPVSGSYVDVSWQASSPSWAGLFPGSDFYRCPCSGD
ncbi:hypothetical protein V6N11_064511 [Hibiscus sabdariffa]